MPTTPIEASAVTLVALAALLFAESRDSRVGRWLAKPLASLGFIATGLLAASQWGRFEMVMMAALVLCALGDVLLIPKSMAWFQAGLFAFLAGHLAFATAMVIRGVDWRFVAAGGAASATVAVLVGWWLLPKVEAKMRGPVLAYMCVISAMVALAAGTFARGGNALLLVAAIAFFFSDVSVARDTFVARGFVNRAWGLPLYYGAQIAFALALVAG